MRELDFVENKERLKNNESFIKQLGKVMLTGGNKCPICGKVFEATPPLMPNVKDRDFYGGRVKFFKQVTCDCTGEYVLCVEKKLESAKVINMIVVKEGIPLAELKKIEGEKIKEEAEESAAQALSEIIEDTGEVPTLKQRTEIKNQHILATVIDKDAKIETLMHLTIRELQTMCKRRKLKFNKKDNKTKLAEKLLIYDPSVVIANPEG